MVNMTSRMGLFGTLPGIIMLNTCFALPILTLLFRNVYATLPPTLVKAAQVDGCGFWSTYWHVILPLSKPALVVAVILQATWVWNEYLLALVFAGRDNMPVTVLLNNIAGSQTGEARYNVDMAAALIAAAVPLTIYLVSGRWFARGYTDGAVRG